MSGTHSSPNSKMTSIAGSISSKVEGGICGDEGREGGCTAGETQMMKDNGKLNINQMKMKGAT